MLLAGYRSLIANSRIASPPPTKPDRLRPNPTLLRTTSRMLLQELEKGMELLRAQQSKKAEILAPPKLLRKLWMCQ